MDEKEYIKSLLKKYYVDTTNIVNEYVKKIYVINLKKNKTRKKYILNIMKKFEISFHLVIVDKVNEDDFNNYNKFNNNISIGELGCCLSHLWCLQDIIKNKYKSAIIFEDDIIFHKNFEAKFYNIINKQNYDFLLLGACDYHFSNVNYKNIKDNLYRPNIKFNEVYGAHANYYSYEGAKFMYKSKLNKLAFFDYDYHKIFSYFENSSFICHPNLVITELSTSDIDHSYEMFSENEKKFLSKCFINLNFQDYHFISLNIFNSKNINNIKNINNFDSYIEYLFFLFKQKYKNTINFYAFKNRLDLQLFSLKDIKYITS